MSPPCRSQSPAMMRRTQESSPFSSCDTSDTESCSLPVNSASLLRRQQTAQKGSPIRGHVMRKAKVSDMKKKKNKFKLVCPYAIEPCSPWGTPFWEPLSLSGSLVLLYVTRLQRLKPWNAELSKFESAPKSIEKNSNLTWRHKNSQYSNKMVNIMFAAPLISHSP